MNFHKNVIATASIHDLIDLGWTFGGVTPVSDLAIYYDVTICVDDFGYASYYFSDKCRDPFDDWTITRHHNINNQKVIKDLHILNRQKKLMFVTKY